MRPEVTFEESHGLEREMRRPATTRGVAIALVLAAGCAAAGCAAPGPGPAGPGVPSSPTAGPPAVEPPPVEAGVAAPPGTYDQPVDVLAYDLEIAVSDTASWIQGLARLDVAATGPMAEPLGLDFTGLAVDGVSVDGVPVEAHHEAGRLHVPLPAGAGTVTVAVRYRGVPDDGLILGENVHGHPSAFADNWPNRARFWFPGVDHPSDKATVRFTIHAPAEWAVVANGRQVGEPEPTGPEAFGPTASGPRRTWRWSQDVPVSTYNMVFGGAVMAVDGVGLAACGRAPASPRPDGCVEVSTWLFPESVEAGSASFVRAAAMVEHFTDLVGPFPYAKLANVQSSTRFGGMENASAIFYSEAAIAGGRDIEGTVSHEIAHQWFGDSVTEAEWHHLWLSEGFATYFGAQFFEAADGPEAFRARMDEARDRYLASDVVDRPVVDPEVRDLFALLNRNNYQKGAWVLHMLRGVVGDEAFFGGVRDYYRRFADSVALTSDFREAMERASGEDLRWFFDQWIHRPGHPVFELGSRWTAGGDEYTVTVRQVQDPSWPTFRVPTVLELHHGDGVTRVPVVIDEREEEFRIPVSGTPRRLVLDPDGWVLGKLAEPVEGG